MSFGGSGSGAGVNVGTVTALYKFDATQAMNTIGQLNVAANNLRANFGNVTLKLDTGNSAQQVNELITATKEYKQALADSATALAQKRQAETQNIQLMGQSKQVYVDVAKAALDLKNTQLATAQSTQQYNDAIKQEALATAEARTAMAEYNTSSAQMRNEMVAARQAALEEAAALKETSSSGGSFLAFLRDSALAGAAFRAGQMAATEAIYAVRDALTQSVGAAVSWQQTLNQVQSNTTLTTGDISQMDTTIKQLAGSSPANMDQLAQGFRIASSEGFSLGDSTKIVDAAMKSAIPTGANLTATINELATVMHIFHVGTDDSTQSMDLLHQASVLGKTDLEEFVTGTQRAYATAANYGVSLKDASAALADFTRNGYTATQAGTQLTGLITHISAPTAAAKQEIINLSKSTGVDLVSDFSKAGLASKGLDGVLQDLQTVINKTGDDSIISRLVPALRGAQGAYILLGNGAQDYKDIQANLDQVMNGTSTPTMDAYNRTVNTAAFQIGTLKNEFHLFALEIGQYLLPAIEAAVQWMSALLQAMGVDFKVPGMEQAKQATDGLGQSVQTATQNSDALTKSATDDKSQAIIDASKSVDDFGAKALDAAANIRTLTDAANGLKTQMDGINENMASVTDHYKGLIDPAEAQLKSINAITPDEFARHMTELGLQSQQIQMTLAKPDTSQFDKTIEDSRQKILDMGDAPVQAFTKNIDDLRQKLDDLGDANTTAVDAKITGLQAKLKTLGAISTVEIDKQITALRDQQNALGNTVGMDRQIQDLQEQLNKPDQSTAVQDAGAASLVAQLGAGTIDQGAFDKQYQAIGQQRQAIVETNTIRKTALQQEIADLEDKRELQKRADEDEKAALDIRIKTLETQKASTIEQNTIDKANIQTQLDAATAEKTGIETTHKAAVDSLNDQIKTQEKLKASAQAKYDSEKKSYEDAAKQATLSKDVALRDYNAKQLAITQQLDQNKLLDDASKINKDILSYPLTEKVNGWKEAMAAALLPLQQNKDDLQKIIDKNNEDLAGWRSKEAEIKANDAAAKELLKTLQDPAMNPDSNAPEGVPGGPPIPKGTGTPVNELQGAFGSGTGSKNVPGWLGDLMNDLKQARADLDPLVANLQKDFDDLLIWGQSHKQDFKDAFGQAWDDIVLTVTVSEQAISHSVRILNDVYTKDWKQLWIDIGGVTKDGTDTSLTVYDEFGKNMGKEQYTHHDATTTQWTRFLNANKTSWNDTFGEDAAPTRALGTFKNANISAFHDMFDEDSAPRRAISGFVTAHKGSFQDMFGDDSAPRQTLDRFMTWTSTQFTTQLGENGVVAMAAKGLGNYFTQAFKPGGDWATQFSALGTTVNGFVGEGGSVGHAFDWLGTHVHDFFQEGGPVGSAISSFGSIMKRVLNDGIVDPINTVLGKFGDFVNFIGGGIGDLASKLHVDLTIPKWNVPQIPPMLAVGTNNWQGGPAIVGDAGAELGIINGMAKLFDKPTLLDLPAGSVIKTASETASILRNTEANAGNIGGGDGLAASLAAGNGTGNYGLGGILDTLGGAKDAALGGVKSLGGAALNAVSGIIGKGLGAAVDGIMSAAGVPDLTMGGVNLGTGVVSMVKDLLMNGLKDLWDGVTGALPSQNLGARGGGVTGDSDLINAIKAATNDGAEQQAMLFGAFLETGGRNVAQIGGGPGAGYWQIEAGPGGQYAGQVDPYDPMAAARFMEGDYRAAMGYYNTDDLEASLAAVAYHAERPAKFYDDAQIGSAWNLIQPFLTQGAISGPSGPATPGGNSAVVDQAARFLGDVDSGGLTEDGMWSGWCERFVEFMNQYAGTGLSSGTFNSAAIHMNNSMTNTDENPPPGASVFWYGPGWGGSYGHVGVAVGDGSVISTTGLVGSGTPIKQSTGWIGASGYQGWAPPGLALGGVATTPQIVTIGDIGGNVPEIVAPQPMMKQSVKDAIMEMGGGVGGGNQVIFQAGSIVQQPGEDAEALADRIGDVIMRRMNRGGRNT